jgi:hypothetical protein
MRSGNHNFRTHNVARTENKTMVISTVIYGFNVKFTCQTKILARNKIKQINNMKLCTCLCLLGKVQGTIKHSSKDMAINHWTKQQRSNNGEPQKQITVTKSRAD